MADTVFMCRWRNFHPLLLAFMLLNETCIAKSSVHFNQDIRPILAEACLACHGPDSASRQADLRLDKREVAVERAAIVPGDPDASEMIRRILSEDASEKMPPPETKKSLSEKQKRLLIQWIHDGADYQPNWSLIAPARPPIPQVQNSSWLRNPIDSFIAARLESAGLTPQIARIGAR
jgi:hypothetical protein